MIHKSLKKIRKRELSCKYQILDIKLDIHMVRKTIWHTMTKIEQNNLKNQSLQGLIKKKLTGVIFRPIFFKCISSSKLYEIL